jgi:hypothetical protein
MTQYAGGWVILSTVLRHQWARSSQPHALGPFQRVSAQSSRVRISGSSTQMPHFRPALLRLYYMAMAPLARSYVIMTDWGKTPGLGLLPGPRVGPPKRLDTCSSRQLNT